MKSLFKNLTNLNAHDQEDGDDDSISNNINFKYYQIDELKKEIVRNGKFSLLHLNIASLDVHKDAFEDMLSILDLDFDILGLTETRIIKEQNPTYDTSITAPLIGGEKQSRKILRDQIVYKPLLVLAEMKHNNII